MITFNYYIIYYFWNKLRDNPDSYSFYLEFILIYNFYKWGLNFVGSHLSFVSLFDQKRKFVPPYNSQLWEDTKMSPNKCWLAKTEEFYSFLDQCQNEFTILRIFFALIWDKVAIRIKKNTISYSCVLCHDYK